jgi:hypothetical protein
MLSKDLVQSTCKGAKRDRATGAANKAAANAHEQLLLINTVLQSRLGKAQCGAGDLIELMVLHGFMRWVRTIDLEIRPLGGDSFKVTIDATRPSVGKVKAEIAQTHGTPEDHQELYKVAIRADGKAVREDDADAEELDDDGMLLRDKEVVAMAVKEVLVWQTYPDDRVTLRERGIVATQHCKKSSGAVAMHGFTGAWSLTTSGVELTEGRYFWEVSLVSYDIEEIYVGVCKSKLDPRGDYLDVNCSSGWFLRASKGALCGNGKSDDDSAGEWAPSAVVDLFLSLCPLGTQPPGRCEQGDRIGILVDMDKGTLLFYKNGVQHGPGYPAGSVVGPVVHAVQMFGSGQSVRLLPNAQQPQPLAPPQDASGGRNSSDDEVQRDASGLALFSFKR